MADFRDRLCEALSDRYRVVEELGEGGMAIVFRAREVKHDRDVALKVLKPELAAVIGADRFLHEIRVTARLHHSHILPLHDSGEVDGCLYYVMPFVEGESVADRVAREGALPIADVLRIGRDAARALHYAHEHGVVHRDIKPGNILLDSGNAVLADFGVAQMADQAMDARLTATGVAVGTPLYMSPEQATGGTIDRRTDVYALGCVLYEMLTGEPPHPGTSLTVVAAKRLSDPVPSPRRLRSAIPPEVDQAVIRSLQVTPADRYQTAEEMAEALALALSRHQAGVSGEQATQLTPSASGSGAVPAVGPGEPRSASGSPSGRRVRSVLVPAAATALVALGAWQIPRLLGGARGGEVPGLPEATFVQATREPGAELFPSLSRDGSLAVYARNGTLRLREFPSGADRALTSDPRAGDTQPALTPDGSTVAFVSSRDGGGIFLLDVASGEVRRLTNFGFNPAWSPDGTRVAFAYESVSEPSTRRGLSNLFIVDVATGDQRQVGEMDGVQPSWSPDGARLAFWSVMRDGRLTGQRDLWTIAATGGEPVLVTDDAAVDWNPVWAWDGRSLFFSSNRGGSMNVWNVPVDSATGRASGAPRPVTRGGTASQEHITVASNGTGLFVERLTSSNIWRVPLDPARGVVTGDPEPVTEGANMFIEPSGSPDGSEVTFFSIVEPMRIHVARSDGSGVRAITPEEGHDRSPQWSPDGGSIVFHSDRGDGRYQIWRTDPAGETVVQLTNSSAVTLYPFWHPGGERVGFVELGRGIASVDREAGVGSLQTVIRGDVMVRPQWSPDGRRIAGVYSPNAGGTGIVVVDPDTGARQTVASFGDAPQWLPDSRRLVFVDGNTIYLADVDAGSVRELFSLGRDAGGLGSVSRDGRWLYFSRTVTEADLWSLRWD